jgi:hypothetical protein
VSDESFFLAAISRRSRNRTPWQSVPAPAVGRGAGGSASTAAGRSRS